MATTIASLHLLAVLGIALLTKSRLLTWLSALAVLYVAFAVGSSNYALVDAISTFIGLGMGLSLIGKEHGPKRRPARLHGTESVSPTGNQSISVAERQRAPSADSLPIAISPARDFELHPKPQRGFGRWFALGLILCAVAWGYYS